MRPRRLLKARTLLDAAQASSLLMSHFTEAQQLPDEVQREILGLAYGLFGCIITRKAQGQGLPRVGLVVGGGGDEQEVAAAACVKYALHGIARSVFVELCQLMVAP